MIRRSKRSTTDKADMKESVDVKDGQQSEKETTIIRSNRGQQKADHDMSEYEKIRLANIERNQAFLSNLGLNDVKPDVSVLAARRVESSRGTTSSSSSKRVVMPVRRSSRVTIEKLKDDLEQLHNEAEASPSIEKDNEIKEKEDLLADMIKQKSATNFDYASIAAADDEYQPKSRLSRDPISLLMPKNKPIDIDEAEDEKFWGRALINVLKEISPIHSSSTSSSSLVIPDSPLKSKKQKITPHSSSSSSSSSFGNTAAIIPDYHHAQDMKSYIQSMNNLSVSEDDVAKITESRITSVFLHPSTSKLICAAGDKAGNLGIWDVDSKSTGTDGVFKYRPHVEGINKIFSWYDDPSKIYTCSYDGTIRYIDMNKESIVLGFEAPEDYSQDIAFSDVAYLNHIPNILLIGRSDGKICLADLRLNSSLTTHKYEWCSNQFIHPARIQSIQYHPLNEHLIITAGAKMTGCITVHDIRKKPSSGGSSVWKPVSTLDYHTKSINAAYCSPDGKYLISVSQDNTIRTSTHFDGTSSSSASTSSSSGSGTSVTGNHGGVQTIKTSHDNHTGRWLSTLRPTFDPKQPHSFVLGSMERPRRIEIFCPSGGGYSKHDTDDDDDGGGNTAMTTGKNGEIENGKRKSINMKQEDEKKKSSSSSSEKLELNCIASIQSDPYLASVCSRNTFHPFLNIIAGGNSSGRVHILR